MNFYLPTILNGSTKLVKLKSAKARLTTNIFPIVLSGLRKEGKIVPIKRQDCRVYKLIKILSKIIVNGWIKLPYKLKQMR